MAHWKHQEIDIFAFLLEHFIHPISITNTNYFSILVFTLQ